MKKSRVKFTDIATGSGAMADGDVWVKVRTRIFLNRGDELKDLWGGDGDAILFRLRDREIIPGLRYAVEGMRVGGCREATIPPHLAYGDTGIPELIPPNAVLRIELELLEFGAPGEALPSNREPAPGAMFSISASGEESSTLPRWDLVFYDQVHPHYPSKCFLLLEWSTRSDGKWGGRSAEKRTIELSLDPSEIEQLIVQGKDIPGSRPPDFLLDEVHCHGGNSPTRANSDSVICWSLTIVENGNWQMLGHIRENSPFWTESEWGKRVMSLVRPHLAEAPWRLRAKQQNP